MKQRDMPVLLRRDRIIKAHVDAYDRKGPSGMVHVEAYDTKAPSAQPEPPTGPRMSHAESLYHQARGLRSFTSALTEPQKNKVTMKTPDVGGEKKRPQFRPQTRPGRFIDPIEAAAKQTPRIVTAAYAAVRNGASINQGMSYFNSGSEIQRSAFDLWLTRTQHPLAQHEGTTAERFRMFLEEMNERREQYDAKRKKIFNKQNVEAPAAKLTASSPVETETPPESPRQDETNQRASLLRQLDDAPDGARFIVPVAPKKSGLAGTWEKTTVAGEHYWKRGARYVQSDVFLAHDEVRRSVAKQVEEGLQQAKGRRVTRGQVALSALPTERKTPKEPERASSEQMTARNFTIPAQHLGKEEDTFTESGRTVKIRYALVDAYEPIASHDTSYRHNPEYPKELQPRDRTRAGSGNQVRDIIGVFNPALMGRNPKSSEGAPMIGKDGAVEIGNGRMIVMRTIYERHPDLAHNYKTWLAENAKDFGLDDKEVQALAHPLLVRIRETPLDRVAFTRETNKEGASKYSPAEEARNDARFLSPEKMGLLNTEADLDSLENVPFIRSFMSEMHSSESGELLTAKGRLNPKGYIRIRNAMLQHAYEHPDLIERLTEGADDNIKHISQALTALSPRMASVKAGMAAGALYKDLDATYDIAEAASVFSELRQEKTSVSDYLNQAEIGGPRLSDNGRFLLGVMDEYARRPAKLRGFLANYASFVESAGDPRSTSMFAGGPQPTSLEALQYAKALTDTSEKVELQKEALFGGAKLGNMTDEDVSLHQAVRSTNETMYAESHNGDRVKVQTLPIGRTHPSGKSIVLEDGGEISNDAVRRIVTQSGQEVWRRKPTETPQEEQPKEEDTQTMSMFRSFGSRIYLRKDRLGHLAA